MKETTNINENQTETLETHVPMSQKVYYGLGNLGSGLIMGIFNAATIKYYSDVVGLSAKTISIAFLIYAIWNAINDPIFGFLSDRIQWKNKSIGNRIPWLRIINPFLATFFVLTWYAPINKGLISGLYLFVMLLLYDTCYTIVGLNQGALLADMSSSTVERSNIQLVGSLFGAVSAALSLIIPSTLLTNNINVELFRIVMLITSAVCLITMQISAYHVRIRFIAPPETPLGFVESMKESLKNKSFMILVASNFFMIFLSAVAIGGLFYFTEYVLGVVGTAIILPLIIILGGVVSGAYLLMQWVRNVGLKIAMLRGLIVAGVGLVVLTIMPGWTIYIPLVCVGFGIVIPMLAFNVFIGDLADEDELKTGNRREGMFFGFNALLTKPAQSIGAAFIAYMLEIFEYIKPIEQNGVFLSQPQSEFTILGIKLMFGLIPGILVLISALIFSKYDLTGERLTKVKNDLELYNIQKMHKLQENDQELPGNLE